MNNEEKDKILLQFLKSDKIYLQALLYAIILGLSGNFVIMLGYNLFLERTQLIIKIILFDIFFLTLFYYRCKIYTNFQSINKKLNYLLHKHDL
ncbi:hypothetical protein HYT25_01635 [Candidatus Pacearchaeota archaeon]|nr:hypothetical protein [Candidatus Pacearchaeota archaeon]